MTIDVNKKFKELLLEFKYINWSNKSTILKAVVFVIILSILFGSFLYLVDVLVNYILKFVLFHSYKTGG